MVLNNRNYFGFVTHLTAGEAESEGRENRPLFSSGVVFF